MVDFENNEDAVSCAQQIMSEESERKVHLLGLHPETVKFLESLLKTSQLIDSTLAKLFKRPTRLGFSHPDSMESILRDKFKPVLEDAEGEEKLSVGLTEREIMYLNNKLARGISGVKESGSIELDRSLAQRQIDSNLEWLKESVPAFRDLNTALIKEGMAPHPDAAKMFDDLKLPKQRDD